MADWKNRKNSGGYNASTPKGMIAPAPTYCTKCDENEATLNFLGVYKQNGQKLVNAPSKFLVTKSGKITLELQDGYTFGKWITRCDPCFNAEREASTHD